MTWRLTCNARADSTPARDEFAGKRCECQFCGRILSIPQLAPSPPPGTPPSGKAAARKPEEAFQITEYSRSAGRSVS